jgi:hypothetical protein
MSDADEWYWDLDKKVAVMAQDRGPGDHMLGPYPSKYEAEHWKDTSEQRNEAWDDADEQWTNPDR